MGSNRRQFERMKQRLSCELHHDGRKTTGMVVDVSARGLFVRTSTGTAPPTGAEVRVVLKGAEEGDIELMARMRRAHVVRRELVSAAGGGVGLEVVSAPESFYALLKPLAES